MSGVPNAHGVYVDHDCIRLDEAKTRIALAEIRVAETPGGWRATSCFMFTTGNWWGCSSPITDHDKPFPHRDEAISYAAANLAERLTSAPRHAVEPTMEGQRRKIVEWLTKLTKPAPLQMEMFA